MIKIKKDIVKRIVHNIKIQYISINKPQFIILLTHNLKTTFEKFNCIDKSFYFNRINGSEIFQNFPGIHISLIFQIIALALPAESIEINPDNCLIVKLKASRCAK
jgi:hypothetical protein